jgi:two-component system, OmpR family, sensor histidine kinase TorS
VADDLIESELDPILSIKVLQELQSFGGLREIVHEFLNEAPTRIQAIQQLSTEKRYDALALQAHALKGASGATGAIRLSRVSAKLESAARSNSEERLAMIIEDLVEEFDIAHQALLELLVDDSEDEQE